MLLRSSLFVIVQTGQTKRLHCLDTASSGDAALQVGKGVRHIASVSKVASSDHKATAADTVGNVAEGEGLLRWEVGDLAILLGIAGVAVKHDTSDLVIDGSGNTLDGSDHDGSALRVTTGNDDGVRALGGSKVEKALGLAVGSAVGSFRKGVGAYAGGVGAANTLAGDVAGAVFGLEAFASRRANGGALSKKCQFWEGCIKWYYKHAYNVANFCGATSEDECNGTAASAGELVDGRANTSAKLSALDGRGKGCGSAGEKSNDCGELHVSA
jgi:hypothetical protein